MVPTDTLPVEIVVDQQLTVTPVPTRSGYPTSYVVRGEIDVANRARLRRALDAIVDSGDDVHLDMRGVSFADVATATMLVDTARRLPRPFRLILQGPPRHLASMIELLWPTVRSAYREPRTQRPDLILAR